MNGLNLTLNPQALELLQPLLRLAGVDPGTIGRKLGRAQVAGRMQKATAAVVGRMEDARLTPALKGDSPQAERVLVREAMRLLAKEIVRPVVPRWAVAFVADGIRDAYDDQVVPLALPRFDAGNTTAEMVWVVQEAWLEVLF